MPDIDFASDVAAITHVINCYSLAMDTREWALMDDVFLPDAVITMNQEPPMVGRATGVGFIRICIECCSLTHHSNSNVVARFEGRDRAHVISNFRAWHRGLGDKAEETFETLGAYTDEFVRTQKGWRIARRAENNPIVFGDFSIFDSAIPRVKALL